MADLTQNVDELLDKIAEIGGKISSPIAVPDIESAYMDDDECLRQMILKESSEDPNNRIPLSKEAWENENGMPLPDNVLTAEDIANSYPDNHPTKELIREKKKSVKVAVQQLGIKGGEIVQAIAQLNVETVAAFITIGSSAAIMPFGAGLPTAFSALQGIFSSLEAFQTKMNQITPIIKELKYVEMLIPEDSPVNTSLNTVLSTVKNSLNGVNGVTNTIGRIKSAIGGMKAPGSTGIPGITAPPNPIRGGDRPLPWIWPGYDDQQSSGSLDTGILPGEKVWLSVIATEGMWDYIYWWSADNDPDFQSYNKRALNVYPKVTTTYTVQIKNRDGSGERWAQITIKVVPRETISVEDSGVSSTT